MGLGDFSCPDGCGRGEGQVHLRITYTPFTMFEHHPADSVTVRPKPQAAAPAAALHQASVLGSSTAV